MTEFRGACPFRTCVEFHIEGVFLVSTLVPRSSRANIPVRPFWSLLLDNQSLIYCSSTEATAC